MIQRHPIGHRFTLGGLRDPSGSMRAGAMPRGPLARAAHWTRLLSASLAALIPAVQAVSVEIMEMDNLVASDSAFNERFGSSVAADGDVAVAGAHFDVVNFKRNAGSAYVFRYDGSQWSQQEKLVASDVQQFDQFGAAVAVSGDAAVVGSRLKDDGGPSAGAAYVFRFDGTVWVEEAKLVASDPEAGAQFGSAVAISGDRILIGAFGATSKTGAAYLFRYDVAVASWVEEARLSPGDLASGAEFGSSVALDGGTAVVGAHLDDVPANDTGSAYVFQHDGSVWVERAKLSAADGLADDRFGFALAVSGNAVLVGAPLANSPGLDPGAAYVFRADGFQWTQEAKLSPSDAAAGRRFGISVGLDGETAVIGSDDASGVFGRAYVFSYHEAQMQWIEEGVFAASDNAPGDHFGNSVAITGARAVVGAFGDSNHAGSAYLFNVPAGEAPEPSLLLALLSGIGMLGVLDRRRRGRAKPAQPANQNVEARAWAE